MTVHKLHRKSDPETSRMAAETIEKKLGQLQQMVLDAFQIHGPMTSDELIRLPRFDGYKESSSRGRIPELIEKGLLVEFGEKTNSGGHRMKIYAFKPRGTLF